MTGVLVGGRNPRRRRGGEGLRAVVCGLGLAPLALTLLSGTPAHAACDPAVSGGTVTCSGTETNPVGTGAENNVTVNVQSGASITVGDDQSAIYLQNTNRVVNSGTITTGNSVLDLAAGVNVLDDGNVIINNGTIAVGNGDPGFGPAFGILAGSNNNVLTNNNLITGGMLSIGISACCGNTITNSATGTIRLGDSSEGIKASSNNVVSNAGSIVVGNGNSANGPSVGILAFGSGNTITNSGHITAGNGDGLGIASGILVLGANNTVTNSGQIDVGSVGIGMGWFFGPGSGNTFINTSGGVIRAGDTSFGIYGGDGNAVRNDGTIIVGNAAYGIGFGSGNDILNSGSVFAPNGIAIFGLSDNTITNTGTLQGSIVLGGPDNTFINRGYIISGDPSSFTTPFPSFFGGTLINDPDGTIAVRVAPSFNDSYQADTITLNGGRLHIVVTPGLYGTTTVYSQATTGASPLQTCGCSPDLTGTFDTVSTSSPFFVATPDYTTAGEVDVTLTRLGFGSVPGMTPNQQAVGNALERGYSTGLSGNAATLYGSLFTANSVAVLDQLSGAGTAAAQDASFSAAALFNNAMMQQGVAWLTGAPGGNSVSVGAPLGYAAAPHAKNKAGQDAFAAMQPRVAEPARWRAWAVGFGGTRSTDGDASLRTADQSTRTAGGAAGVDHQIGDLLLGVAAGGSSSHFSVPSLSTSGDIDGGHVGAYAFKSFGAAYAAATVNYAHFSNKTERTISGVGATENASGSFSSDQLGGRFELGWRKHFEHFTLTPFAAVEPAALWQSAYTETSTTASGGSGVLGLSYSAHTTTSLPIFLGAQIDTRYVLAGGQVVSPIVRLSWVHEFKPDREVEASFVSIPSTLFTVDGARAARDSARLDTGVTLALNQSVGLFANFNGEFSSESQMASATGGAKITW
jgi:uncharacterized protein with beta-barrel porin domain